MPLYIGLMSGTSMDSIDGVLIKSESFEIQATHTTLFPQSLKNQLSELVKNHKISLKDLGTLDIKLGYLFAETATEILKKANTSPTKIQGIGSHGQTIYHYPNQTSYPFTLQLADPNIIAEITGVTTVADFRRRDMAAGGQGAPLTSAFHATLLQKKIFNQDIAVLNIGGIANISLLPANQDLPIWGFDTGPGNTLMDQWIAEHQDQVMDQNGIWAASGRMNDELLHMLLDDPYFSLKPPKSTGREYFNLFWLQDILNKVNKKISPEDVQATLCTLTAKSIQLAVTSSHFQPNELVVCGGGAYNKTLMENLQRVLPHCKITTTTDYGIPPKWVESCAFAWLAKQTLEGLPGNIPTVTGAKRSVILGAIYPAKKLPSSFA
ncbi:anhydro-N-acetylmuramic acid kinase [Candidatus Nitrosacidococcus tergens]|uniref:Anhydro-N-acetylmuramic acid kinase n=1 Tax=Candidatus Nitrosacidococcus tergens TaxID=553981 RepID=A0A7G1QA95_9GAMM|nr:anhydro-N-acetylmuramic acid kinase [Candidatus Nitrosacidococcus tergens]